MLSESYDEALGTFSKVLMKEPTNSLARINVGYICLKKRIFGEAIEHLSRAIRLDNDRKATLYAHYYLGLVYLEREMYEDAQTFFRKTLGLGPGLVEAWFELGRALWFGGDKEGAKQAWTDGIKANRFNPWAKRCKELLDLAEKGDEIPRGATSPR
jgi:tetratricopeptide (TPR) repeat protein